MSGALMQHSRRTATGRDPSFTFITAIGPLSSPIGLYLAHKVVDGLELHYLTAGHGPSVILLHGYARTSRMWRPIMPILAERFTVIAPTYPESATPPSPKTAWT